MASARSKKVAFSVDRPSPRPAPTHRPATQGPSRIRCFDGLIRRTTDWHGLNRDRQLWFAEGDCLVHFATSSDSPPPSLKLPFKAIKALQSQHLFRNYLRTRGYLDIDPADQSSPDDSGYASSPSEGGSNETTRELCIPAPSGLTQRDTLRYNLATRNFFAYAVCRPVVGERLSTALRDLWHRIQEWQPGSSKAVIAFTAYLRRQGYSNFAENAEHALACLNLADEARLRHLWIDAFAHCVGMHNRLELSPEFHAMRGDAMAMITRASLEMDLKVARTLRAVAGFLENELGPEHLGLSKAARDHLDRFRSFLHGIYVGRLGYFPPHPDARWSRPVWGAIQADFECLYRYLVDQTSSTDLASNKRLDGGICVLQNVKAFDERHGFDGLPHPLPLLPAASAPGSSRATSKRRHSLRLGMNSLLPEHDRRQRPVQTLATNIDDDAVMLCELVHKYQLFERQRLEEKLDPVEARKVRWLLVYGVLQMLNSVVKPPHGVTNAHDVSYPVCISMHNLPHWLHEPEEKRDSGRISIHPDCEADCAHDFFASTRSTASDASRNASAVSLSRARTPTPLKIKAPLSRTNSLRSSVQSLHKSVVGSLARRGSSRRHSTQSDIVKLSACESVQEDGLCEPHSADDVTGKDGESWLTAKSIVEEPEPMQAFDFDLQQPTDNHVAVKHHRISLPPLERALRKDYAIDAVESDSALKAAMQQKSSRSVPNLTHEIYTCAVTPPQIDSGLEQLSHGRKNCVTPSRGSTRRHSTVDVASHDLDDRRPSTGSAPRASMNAGCYVPSGMTQSAESTRTSSQQSSAWDEEMIDINDALQGNYTIYDPPKHKLEKSVRALHFLENSWTSCSDPVSVM